MFKKRLSLLRMVNIISRYNVICFINNLNFPFKIVTSYKIRKKPISYWNSNNSINANFIVFEIATIATAWLTHHVFVFIVIVKLMQFACF